MKTKNSAKTLTCTCARNQAPFPTTSLCQFSNYRQSPQRFRRSASKPHLIASLIVPYFKPFSPPPYTHQPANIIKWSYIYLSINPSYAQVNSAQHNSIDRLPHGHGATLQLTPTLPLACRIISYLLCMVRKVDLEPTKPPPPPQAPTYLYMQ